MSKYVKFTKHDGKPVWINASFIVTVEPMPNGGAIVVPIGDGLDYEVRESPETVLEMLQDAPAAAVVPVPPPQALAMSAEDVSPEEPEREPEPAKAERKTAAAKKTATKTAAKASAKTAKKPSAGTSATAKKTKTAKKAEEKESAGETTAETVAAETTEAVESAVETPATAVADTPAATGKASAPAERSFSKTDEMIAKISANKCRTATRLANFIKNKYKKLSDAEVEKLIGEMKSRGIIEIQDGGHVEWIKGG